ncbi:MAG: SH3 domain-containing protein [Reyranellaceae bacterium]
MRFSPAIAAAGLVLALLAAPPVSRAADDPPDPSSKAAQAGKGSGLPVPRFASVRSDEVNVRTGPGTRYPVEWVFQRKNMPVEVISEFDTWRRIRDWQGATGWVHQSMLTGKRTVVVTAREAVLLRTPEPGATAVARLEPAVQAEVLNCKGGFCRIEVQKHRGWIERKALWGIYPNETID